MRNIINKKYYLCPLCNRIRIDERKGVIREYKGLRKRRFNEKFKYDTRWGFTSEMDMFKWISQNRAHRSELSGRPITGELQPHNFLHILPKALGKYPHFRLNPDNVVLGTLEEHNIIDAGWEDQKNKLPGYAKFKIKKAKLIEEYIRLYH